MAQERGEHGAMQAEKQGFQSGRVDGTSFHRAGGWQGRRKLPDVACGKSLRP